MSIKFIAIAAMARNRIIWNNGKIPWYIPEDFKHFKETTEWCPIIMGRKTFDSIGRVLPGRENIVLTRWDFNFPGVTVVHSIDELELYLSKHGINRAYICGGSQIYEEFFKLGKTDEVILSIIDMIPEGDAAFPYFEEDFTKIAQDKREGFVIEYWKKWHIPHQNPHY